MSIKQLILASLIATVGGIAITNHFENIGKEKVAEVRQERKENLLDKVTKYVQDDYKAKWRSDLDPERAGLYANMIYEESKRYGVPLDTSLAVASHETSFKNWITDRNLPNKYPESYGPYSMNKWTLEWVIKKMKKLGELEEDVPDVIDERILTRPDVLIKCANWFIAYKKEIKNRESFAKTLAEDYNPGMGKRYVAKVKEKVKKIKKYGI
jgi:hypothetical protein